jgi:hypothetical protein
MPRVMTDSEISDAVKILRQRVSRRPDSSLWDVIFDAEALLRGDRTLASREQIEHWLEQELQIK